MAMPHKDRYEGRKPVTVTAFGTDYKATLYMPWNEYMDAVWHNRFTYKLERTGIWFNGSVQELRKWEYKYAADAQLR